MKLRVAADPPKALSIAQPYAELILRRRKLIEIRSWRTSYRGLLLIHASQRFHATEAREFGIRKDDIAQGALVGIAHLHDVRPFTKRDAKLLKARQGGNGWWGPNHFAWVLKGVHRMKPIPCKGQLNLFSPTPQVLRRIEYV